MTQTNGSVGLMVPVPVLGQVLGTQTLADIAAGKQQEPPTKDAPAVTYKEWTGHALAAAVGGDEGPAATETVAAKPEPKPVAKPPAKPEPKVEPKATPVAVKPAPAGNTPAPAAGDAEAEAKKLLLRADNYADADMTAKAIATLEEIMKKYPKTKAAGEAEVKILTLKK
jgi:outer membrane biosynthesis protein TonB